ncbi:ParB/RepB/Spo0J family partition protein [Sphingomonas oryzagri]
MAKAPQKITLSPSRDIPFDKLILSQSNVRRVKAGVSIPELAEDIARRGLIQGLNVRPVLDGEGQETGSFEVPAGGRRYRALELLIRKKRLAKNAPTPCIVKDANDPIPAEEDSYAENHFREPLHPLDQFRGMQMLVDKGWDVDAIAAHFMTTPAVVTQRLKLASVSPKLHEVYAEERMSLQQLMAFSVSDDHERQEQVWELLAHSLNKSAAYIRDRLTEGAVRVADKRVRFVTVDAYVAAGGRQAMRDLFEEDDGGWLTDPTLLDRLVGEKLQAEGERIGAEGWKWVATALDLPWGVTNGLREIVGTPAPMTAEEDAKLAALQAEADELEDEWADAHDVPDDVSARAVAIDAEIGRLVDRAMTFDPEEMARAGVFVSIDVDGSLLLEGGYVRPEDEPVAEPDGDGAEGDPDAEGNGTDTGRAPASGQDGEDDRGAPVSNVVPITAATDDDDDADDEIVKPLPDRLVADLTAWRTLALQDAFAQSPSTAFAAVLHAFVLSSFYMASRESCLQASLNTVSFGWAPASLRNSGPAKSIAERHARWKERLPRSENDLWEALLQLDGAEQAALFAHCASKAVNAQAEIVPKHDNGRVSKHSVERRLEHSHVLARAVGLDIVGAGWKPTAEDYFRSVTKPRILADVSEAKGPKFAEMIDHLKKGDMAREAERLLDDAGWLPEPMRTPELVDLLAAEQATGTEGAVLPAFLDDEPQPDAESDESFAVAAE